MIDQNRDGLIDVRDLQAIYAQIGMQFSNEAFCLNVKKIFKWHAVAKTSTKGTMDPEESAHNSCNSWPLYARWAD